MKFNIPKNKRNLIIYLLILAIVSGLFVGYAKGVVNQNVVAKVNGENISKDELYDLLLKQSGQQGLNSLISKKIVELEAEKQNIDVSEKELQAEMKQYYDYYGSEKAFTQALEDSVYSVDDIKKETILNLKVKKILKPRITISEAEVKSYFEDNKESLAQEKQVKASHILVETKQKAEELSEKLKKGEDFAKLAQEFSTDATTKESGGSLGFFGSGEMAEEFEEAAFALKVGEVSAPVKTEYGYHLIKVEAKKEAKEAKYEESKAKIRDILFEQKIATEYQTWLQEISQQYQIENFIG